MELDNEDLLNAYSELQYTTAIAWSCDSLEFNT